MRDEGIRNGKLILVKQASDPARSLFSVEFALAINGTACSRPVHGVGSVRGLLGFGKYELGFGKPKLGFARCELVRAKRNEVLAKARLPDFREELSGDESEDKSPKGSTPTWRSKLDGFRKFRCHRGGYRWRTLMDEDSDGEGGDKSPEGSTPTSHDDEGEVGVEALADFGSVG